VLPREAVATLGRSDLIAFYESDITGRVKKKDKIDRHRYFENWELILGWKERGVEKD
jgi:hypothetical protein